MIPANGETSNLLNQLKLGSVPARNALIARACRRLHKLTSRMLKNYPGVRRREETDDVLSNSLIRLNKALSSIVPESSRHFWNLATLEIRRELIDMARHYLGPEGQGANHHTDGEGRAADDEGGPLYECAEREDELASLEEWRLLHEAVATLPEQERAVFNLIFYEGRTREKAAEILSVSVRTVKRKWASAQVLLSMAIAK